MIRKYILLAMAILTLCTVLTGCFDMGGGGFGQPAPTQPPQKEFKTVGEFKSAVAAAKANASTDDGVGLKDITKYYELKAPPEGATLSYIKVSADVIRVGYAYGPVNPDNFDNQIEIAWYRTAGQDFLTKVAGSLPNYDTFSAGGRDYLHIVPDVQLIVTPSPGSPTLAPGATPAPTPTPIATKYCQIVYWVQDDGAFMSAVPLGYTKEDVGKYCVSQVVELK